MEIRNCGCCQAIWFALVWRGPPLKVIENVTDAPNALQQPQAIAQQGSTGQGPTTPFGFLTSNNILLNAEVELANRTSTQDRVLEQNPDEPSRPHTNMQQNVRGPEPVPVQENPTSVFSPNAAEAGTGGETVTDGTSDKENAGSRVEPEATGQGTSMSVQRDITDAGQHSRGLSPVVNSPTPVAEGIEEGREERESDGAGDPRSVLRHVLRAGVVEAAPEGKDEEEVFSEHTHLLDKMAMVGLLYRNK